ncbi:hypothetical protein CPB85DRAFT_1449609 [Mucidula mucida]|nr:hypothetical protein CPB85DRAFT_1449609 [Mucidula mucida]
MSFNLDRELPCALSVDNADYLFAQVFALFVQPPLVFLLSCILGGKCWKNYEGGYLNSSVKTSAVSAILTTLTAFSSTPVILSSADSYRKMHFLVIASNFNHSVNFLYDVSMPVLN